MNIKLTKGNAILIEAYFEAGDEVYVNDNCVDHVYMHEGNLVVEIEGYDRDIPFGEEIDVRIVRVTRTEVEVDFETGY